MSTTSKYYLQMEPETKLFPAIFVEATSKEILQIELGRSATSLPLSAAVLPTSDKHVNPQFPPRLKVQCLKPHQWARVSNHKIVFIIILFNFIIIKRVNNTLIHLFNVKDAKGLTKKYIGLFRLKTFLVE